MSTSEPPARRIERRTLAALIAAGIVVPALGVTQAQAQAAPPATFMLTAEVLDGGQQITSITIDTEGMGPVDPSSLSVETFTVHATASSPSPKLDPNQLYSLYDLDRTVTDIGVDHSGDIVVELLHGEGVPGAATLAYSLQTARNVQVDLDYSVNQNHPVLLASGESASFGGFQQGATVDPEVDRFSQAVSPDGINYRLYSPSVRGNAKRALIVWLHGNGEGGMPGHYNNTSQLLANRGALGPATAEAQAIFKGAFVLAPQVPDTWYNLDQDGYAEKIKALIDSVVASHRIDNGRVYVMGASAGGFMTVQMGSRYPTAFAAIVAVARRCTSTAPGSTRRPRSRSSRSARLPRGSYTPRTTRPCPTTRRACGPTSSTTMPGSPCTTTSSGTGTSSPATSPGSTPPATIRPRTADSASGNGWPARPRVTRG